MELASHLQKAVRTRKMPQEVLIIEMTQSLIGSLPKWMRHYTHKNLEHMGVRIRLNVRAEDISDRTVILSSGERIEGALCIWTTGLIGPSLTRNLGLPSAKSGRITVDECLRFEECCFAAGDVACTPQGARCTRMSVQFAIDQGALAAKNVIASLQAQSLQRFVARDPGFIVPMANGFSCGEILGVKVRGRIPTILHYILGAYRSHGVVNRFGAAAGAFRSFAGIPSSGPFH